MDISAITVEVMKLSLKPGDILALRIKSKLSVEQRNALVAQLERIRPEGVKIAIIDSDCDLQIIEPDKG